MPVRARALALASFLAAGAVLGAVPAARPAPVAAAAPKVAIIVGPVGGMTDGYRTSANRVADAAVAAGATVVKAYSPSATWSRVRTAVDGANVVVYFGHGNGYPNPYTIGYEYTDRVNGWGLNRTTGNGDADDWSKTMVYCGEKALLGTLTSADGAAQRTYCGGGAINPAPGFTMVYAQAHYAPGFGERYVESDPETTLGQARQRVSNYSTPVLRLGGGGYIATAYSDAHEIVSRVLTQPGATYGDIFGAGDGYAPSKLDVTNHADFPGAQVWVQRTIIAGFHFGDPDFWYAFAGDPNRTVGGGAGSYAPFTDIASSRYRDAITWVYQRGLMDGCATGRFCPDSTITRAQLASALARGLALPATANDYFADDEGHRYEADINRLRAAGLTTGCGGGKYCPDTGVRRGVLAGFLARALRLPAAGADYFADDEGSPHEDAINRVRAAAIMSGCGDGNFCPGYRVKRGQAAVFLRNAFD